MTDPHADQPVQTGGTDLDHAAAAVILVHGRGATAQSILQLANEVGTEGVAFLAPQAKRNTWYPNSFLAPLEDNEPGLSSGLSAIDSVLERVESAGIDREQTLLLGFSQGACLASEFVARHPARYGGLVALSGGLIGPPDTDFEYQGSLDGTPVFVGCSDDDPHIPLERVHVTSDTLAAMDADVTERIYEGMGHGVNEEELDHVRTMVEDLPGK